MPVVNCGLTSTVLSNYPTGSGAYDIVAAATAAGPAGQVIVPIGTYEISPTAFTTQTAPVNLYMNLVGFITGDHIGGRLKAQQGSIPTRSGTTQQRPTLTAADIGYPYADTTIQKTVTWWGTAWKDAAGGTA